MNLDFNSEQKLIRTSAREFLQAEVPKDLVRELEDGMATAYSAAVISVLISAADALDHH